MKNLKSFETAVERAILTLTVASLMQAGSSLAALQLRDIDGHPTAVTANAEFAYDTVLDATWYLTANNTGLNWVDANSWAGGLTVGTFSGWSLPAADPACGINYNCSQMGELYYTALGNTESGPLSNTGPFKNLQSYIYWSATEFSANPKLAWYFGTFDGRPALGPKFRVLYALAVRPGDVAAVPEPGTVALLLAGLAGVMVMRRQQGRS